MVRREFLARSAKLTAAVVVAPLAAGLPAAASAGNGKGRGELSLVGCDHVGITVPDIDAAVAWFQDVMGATAPLSFGPIRDDSGTLMHDLLDVDPRAVIDRIAVLRIGH